MVGEQHDLGPLSMGHFRKLQRVVFIPPHIEDHEHITLFRVQQVMRPGVHCGLDVRHIGADHLHVNGLASKFTEADPVVARSAISVQQPVCDDSPAHLAMPVFSSGQTAWQIAPSRGLLGNDDFIFCAGGGIMSHPQGAGAGVIALRQAAEAAREGVAVQDYAIRHNELQAALETFAEPVFALD